MSTAAITAGQMVFVRAQALYADEAPKMSEQQQQPGTCMRMQAWFSSAGFV
jgi:hypothetical protein